jgi:hypothetical protein
MTKKKTVLELIKGVETKCFLQWTMYRLIKGNSQPRAC